MGYPRLNCPKSSTASRAATIWSSPEVAAPTPDRSHKTPIRTNGRACARAESGRRLAMGSAANNVRRRMLALNVVASPHGVGRGQRANQVVFYIVWIFQPHRKTDHPVSNPELCTLGLADPQMCRGRGVGYK